MSLRRSGIITGSALAALVLVAGGATAGILATQQPTPDSLTAPDETGEVDVTTQDFADAQQVTFDVNVSDEIPLTSYQSGTITDVDCAVGDTVESGDSIVSINGEPIVALATSVPLWRDLATNSTGEDVAALNTELRRLGYDANDGDWFGWNTKHAINELRHDLGADDDIASFGASQAIWLRSESTEITACDVEVGDDFTGGAIAHGGGEVTSLALQDRPVDAVAGEREVLMQVADESTGAVTDKQFAIDDGALTDADALDAFMHTAAYQVWKSSDGDRSPELTWQLADPLTVTVVPPGSLGAVTADSACLATPDGAVPVTIIGDSLGKAFITVDDGDAPATVLAHADDDVTC